MSVESDNPQRRGYLNHAVVVTLALDHVRVRHCRRGGVCLGYLGFHRYGCPLADGRYLCRHRCGHWDVRMDQRAIRSRRPLAAQSISGITILTEAARTLHWSHDRRLRTRTQPHTWRVHRCPRPLDSGGAEAGGSSRRDLRVLARADIIVTARIDHTLVGISRAISDFAYCTYLSDLAVEQAFQGRGIGRELIRRTHEAAGLNTSLILIAAPKARTYYPPSAWSLSIRVGPFGASSLNRHCR
jgi:GNAT superfamily N-acetyltransferase